MNAKRHLAGLFLRFVEKYLPIRNASFATLGGRGVEARLWVNSGVQVANCWLIERNHRLGNSLLKSLGRLGMHHHDELATFPQFLQSKYGRSAGLDAFHLDFTGTLESNQDHLRLALGLLLPKEGRCLAITVSDMRGNASLSNHLEVRKEAEKLLGTEETATFLAKLEKQVTPFINGDLAGINVEKTAQKELGFFLVLLNALRVGSKVLILPDVVEKYVYISDYAGTSFRMRTYFFHLAALPEAVSATEAATLLSRTWLESKLLSIHHSEPTRMTETGKHGEGTNMSKLRKLAEVMGGDAEKELQMLEEQAKIGRRLEEFFSRLEKLLSDFRPSADIQSKPPAADSTDKGRQPRQVAKKSKDEDVTERYRRVDIPLRLLRASVNGTYEKEAEKVAKDLGIARKKNRRRTTGGILAHTLGGFRGKFVNHVILHAGDEAEKILAELASLYSQNGTKVTVEKLRQEATRAAK